MGLLHPLQVPNVNTKSQLSLTLTFGKLQRQYYGFFRNRQLVFLWQIIGVFVICMEMYLEQWIDRF